MQYRFGVHTLDTARLQLLDGPTEVELEPQVFSVLTHLVEHRDRVVPKEELLDVVWGSRFVSESALTTRIKQVRSAVGDTGRDQRVVRTSHGRGYRFVASVEVLDAERPGDAGTSRGEVERLRTRYADGDGASIAYQTFGDGPDVVLISGFATNVEVQWAHPAMAAFLHGLGSFARVTVLDKRGVGLSDRLAHDSVPPLETRADDLMVVMDAAGIERACILGSSEGGSLSAVFTASHPERVERLMLHNTWVTGPDLTADLDFVYRRWGSGVVYQVLGPSLASDDEGLELLASYERQSATPRTARHLIELIGRIEIGGILSAIAVPTLVLHRVDDPIVPVAHGRRLADAIVGARLVELAGSDHYLFSGDAGDTLDAIRGFVESGQVVDDPERILVTVLRIEAVAPGDLEAGRSLRGSAGAEIQRARGQVRRIDDNGMVATFDGPGRAVRAAQAAVAGAEGRLRAGLHTTEVELCGDGVAGVGVQIAELVAAAADPGAVWVSRTVTELVAGTGLRFVPRGERRLANLDVPWMLYALAA